MFALFDAVPAAVQAVFVAESEQAPKNERGQSSPYCVIA